MDVPGWITAVGTMMTPIGALLFFFISRPLISKLNEQKEHREDLEKIRRESEAQIAEVKKDTTHRLNNADQRLLTHTQDDAERFDDLSDKLDAKVNSLRREMADAHAAAVRDIREDLRNIAERFDRRFDALVTTVTGRMGAQGDD